MNESCWLFFTATPTPEALTFKGLRQSTPCGMPKATSNSGYLKRLKGTLTMRLMRVNRPEGWNWSPLDQLRTLRNEINRLFENPLADSTGASEVFNTSAPAVDLYAIKDNLIVTTALPRL